MNMLLAPILKNEEKRLQAVHALNLLDTPPEERFDRLVRLTKSVFDAPIVYIALVESNRQWFKSECGLSTSETDRGISFCGHTIAKDEILMVPDTLEDKRFFDNPMVTGHPFIRFYAGRPLKGPSGLNVGSLCVVDTKPREFSEEQLKVLDHLGYIVERELQLADAISTQQELLEARRQLDLAQTRMERELQEASAYVEDQIPAKVSCPDLSIDWKYVASSHLGGDMFGYFPLNEDQWAIYLLDVAGHGIGSSLLAATVNHQLTQKSIAGVDYSDPSSVVEGLNREFPMQNHQNKFFTIWYGVFDKPTRTLSYTTGGHHPALLIPNPQGNDSSSSTNGSGTSTLPAPEFIELGCRHLLVGVAPETKYPGSKIKVDAGTQLYIYSDGVFEVGFHEKNGMGYERFRDEVVNRLSKTKSPVDEIYRFVRDWEGNEELPTISP